MGGESRIQADHVKFRNSAIKDLGGRVLEDRTCASGRDVDQAFPSAPTAATTFIPQINLLPVQLAPPFCSLSQQGLPSDDYSAPHEPHTFKV